MAPTQKEILRRTVEALEASQRRFPENEKILNQLALANFQLGRFDPQAIAVYESASTLFPSDLKIQKATSIGYLLHYSAEMVQDLRSIEDIDQEGLRRNVDRLIRLTTEYPDSPHIHRAVGDLLLLRAEEREAVHHYRCALALGLADLQPICSHFENVRRLQELSGYSAVFFAEMYQRLGSIKRANAIFEEYLDPKNPEKIVLTKYQEFLERLVEESTDRSADAYMQCLRKLTLVCLLRGSMTEALSWARQLSLDEVAKDEFLARELGRRLMQMEDFRLAFDYLSRIPLDDATKNILNEMTVILEKRGEVDTAVYILQYINENDELARDSRELMEGESDNDGREQELQIEIETDLQMAELHWKNRRWDAAFERYLRVLELGYKDYRSLLEPIDLVLTRVEVTHAQLTFLVNFFAERREWRRVIKFANAGLEKEPDSNAMSQRLIQACERILLETPDDHDIRLVHGDEQLRLGNIERAMQDFRRCAEAPEYKMKATRRLAQANFKAGDLFGAYERFRELPVLETEDLERLYDLAVAFNNSGRPKEAYEAARMIEEYDSNFRDVKNKIGQYEEAMNKNQAGFIIDPKMRELIGDHSIGRYKYIGKIGSGGMGVVHKVLDLKTNEVVAMKILREGLSSSGKAIDRFFREARIAATLHHKNIVNILDYNISNNYGQSYIAMEFVDGPSLRDVIEDKFSETVDIEIDDALQALRWVSQLCDALDATHRKGIIHRDIKPDNILIAGGGLVKITDFGIVHVEEATFTPTGALIGTPRYMSPEQVHGGRIDNRSDIYAVGIILYELLIGSPPFISGDISYQQVNVMPTAPREICPAIPQAVNTIILKCLEKSPNARYQDAMECKADVDQAYIRLGGDPREVRPDKSGEVPVAETPVSTKWRRAPTRPIEEKKLFPETRPDSEAQEDIETPLHPHRASETRYLESDIDLPERLETDMDSH